MEHTGISREDASKSLSYYRDDPLQIFRSQIHCLRGMRRIGKVLGVPGLMSWIDSQRVHVLR